MSSQAIELVLRRDRAVIVVALVVITGLAWAYVLWLANDRAMGGMDMTGFRMIPAGMGLMMPASAPWQPIEFTFMFVMWVVMMIGMMTPSAAPMVLLYARVGREAVMQNSNWFFGGYLLAWVAFALVATLAQWAAQRASLLTPMMESASVIFGSALLIAAGLYQWTPLKHACLRQCQAPIHPAPRRIPPRRERLAWTWYSTWCLLCRLLLVVDGAAVRGRRDERAVDSRPNYLRPLGKSNSGRPDDCAGRRRRLVAGGGWLLAAALI